MEPFIVLRDSPIFNSYKTYEEAVDAANYFSVKNNCPSVVCRVVNSIEEPNSQVVAKVSSFETEGD